MVEKGKNTLFYRGEVRFLGVERQESSVWEDLHQDEVLDLVLPSETVPTEFERTIPW